MKNPVQKAGFFCPASVRLANSPCPWFGSELTETGNHDCCTLQSQTQKATILALVKSRRQYAKLVLANDLGQAQAMWIGCCHMISVALN
jgi:hypothetical protein